MPTDLVHRATKPRRRRGRIGAFALVCLLAITGVPVYLLGQGKDESPREHLWKAVVLLPASAVDRDGLDQEILNPAKIERAIRRLGAVKNEAATDPHTLIEILRRRLSVSVAAADQNRSKVAVVYSGPFEGGLAYRLVNELARQFAESRRVAFETQADTAHAEAQAAAERALDGWVGAQRQFDAFLAPFFADNNAQPPSEPTVAGQTSRSPALNPDWAKAKRQLDDLRRWREQLLIDRTESHPQVRAADDEIVHLEERLATIPHELVPSSEDLSQQLEDIADVAPTPSDQTVAEPPFPTPEVARAFIEHRDRLWQTQRQYQQLADRERQTWRSRLSLPLVEVELAEPFGADGNSKASSIVAGSPKRLTMALAVSLAGVIGVLMTTVGTAVEPTFASAVAVESVLGVRVVGAVPSAEPSRPRAPRHRYAGAPVLVACGLLLMGFSLGVVLAVFWGVQIA